MNFGIIRTYVSLNFYAMKLFQGQYIDYDVLLTHCNNDEALCSEVIRFGLIRVHQSRLNSSTNEVL